MSSSPNYFKYCTFIVLVLFVIYLYNDIYYIIVIKTAKPIARTREQSKLLKRLICYIKYMICISDDSV
jgi:hypothetical protein